MKNPHPSIDPPARVIIIMGILLWSIGSAVYLFSPDLIDDLQFGTTDAIVAGAPVIGTSGRVSVVDIDEASLENGVNGRGRDP